MAKKLVTKKMPGRTKTAAKGKTKQAGKSLFLSKDAALRLLLIKELKTNISKMDSKGLAFLLEQSRIHLYNMQVEKLNNARLTAEFTSRSKVSSKKELKVKPDKSFISIKPTSAAFCLQCGGCNTMFSKQEMTHLIKIAQSRGSEPEIGTRIFAWLERERSDVIGTLRLNGRQDVKLALIAEAIRINFKLKNR